MKLTFLLAFILLGGVAAQYDDSGYYTCENGYKQPPHYMCDDYCDCSSNYAYGNGEYCEDEDADICAAADGAADDGAADDGAADDSAVDDGAADDGAADDG